MGTRINIEDDDIAAAARVHIETTPDGAYVTSITFAALPGHRGIGRDAFRLIDKVNLILPEATPHARPVPTPATVTEPPPALDPAELDDVVTARPELPAAPDPVPEPAAVPGPRKPRRQGPPPTSDQLKKAFRLHGGNIDAIANQFGASASTVGNWIRRARENGARITTT